MKKHGNIQTEVDGVRCSWKNVDLEERKKERKKEKEKSK